MKALSKEKLIKALKHTNKCLLYNSIYFQQEIEDIFEEYGDDWFIVDGQWQLVNKNEKEID